MLTSGGGKCKNFQKFWKKIEASMCEQIICFGTRRLPWRREGTFASMLDPSIILIHAQNWPKYPEQLWTTLIKSETHNKWIGNVTKATDFWVVLTCPSFVNLASPGGLGQFWKIWNSQGWEIWEDCYWIQEKHMKYGTGWGGAWGQALCPGS